MTELFRDELVNGGYVLVTASDGWVEVTARRRSTPGLARRIRGFLDGVESANPEAPIERIVEGVLGMIWGEGA
jgi:hypothetical protein